MINKKRYRSKKDYDDYYEKLDKEESSYQKKIVATSWAPEFRSFSSSAYRDRENDDTDWFERITLLYAWNITDVYVGFEALEIGGLEGIEDFGHRVGNLLIPFKTFWPEQICKYAYHSSVWLKTNKGGIVVEYGCYRGTEKKYRDMGKICHYYFEKDFGLRFYSMSFNEYTTKKCKEDKRILADLFPYMRLKATKIKNRTLKGILSDMGADQIYTKSRKHVWQADTYHLINHNCQDFVGEFLDEIGAIRENGEYYRGYHNFAKTSIPWKILKVLEKNEDDSFTELEKTPIGNVFTIGKGLAEAAGSILDDLFG